VDREPEDRERPDAEPELDEREPDDAREREPLDAEREPDDRDEADREPDEREPDDRDEADREADEREVDREPDDREPDDRDEDDRDAPDRDDDAERDRDERRLRVPPFRSAAGISSRATAFVSCGIWLARNFAIRSSSRRMPRASFAVSLSPTVSASVSIEL
jgi:hypothetical protein